MLKASRKKLFLYISLSALIGYFVVVLFAYNANLLPDLYTMDKCSIYYIIVYLLVVATAYYLDTQSRKEPGFLTLFSIPAYSGLFLLGFMMIAGINWSYMIVLLLVIGLLYIAGYFCYKKWIEKIMLIKNGYENILMIYVIIHLFVVLFIAFKIVGFL